MFERKERLWSRGYGPSILPGTHPHPPNIYVSSLQGERCKQSDIEGIEFLHVAYLAFLQ
jgi:hypothetical protein